MRTTAASLFALLASSAVLAGAQAQNYDDTHHVVRVGAFYMPHKVSSDLAIAGGTPVGISNVSHTGGIVAGIEWMRPGWRYGLEFDLAPLSGHAVTTVGEVASNYSATLRARLALELGADWRVYGTLGLAALGLETRTTLIGNVKQSDTKAGFVIGAGFERDWHHVTLFGELLRTSYGSHDVTVGGVSHNYGSLDDTSFRLGLKFKVGHEYTGYHDDVKDRLK